jgi:hypothetical protein
MGNIEGRHITTDSELHTNAAGTGDGGNSTLRNQDERFLLHQPLTEIECDYSPLMDGVEAHKRMIPSTYMDECPDGGVQGFAYEDPKEY